MLDTQAKLKERLTIQPVSIQPQVEKSQIINLIALSRFKTMDLYRFLMKFISQGKQQRDIKDLRANLSRTVPENEKLSDEIIKMREERF
jgi:hypothetical protein